MCEAVTSSCVIACTNIDNRDYITRIGNYSRDSYYVRDDSLQVPNKLS